MKTPIALLLFAFPLLLTPEAVSQSRTTEGAKAAPTETRPFVLPAGNIAVADLIAHCSDYLGCNIIVSPQSLPEAAAITLQHRIETDRDGCEDLLAALLSRNHLALTVLNAELNILEVINLLGPRGREIAARAVWKTPEQILARPQLKVPVITTVELEHINAQLANNALRSFLAGNPSTNGMPLMIGNAGNKRNLVLRGMQDQVAAAIKLIATSDVPPPEVERDELSHLANQLRQLDKRISQLEQQLAKLTKANDR